MKTAIVIGVGPDRRPSRNKCYIECRESEKACAAVHNQRSIDSVIPVRALRRFLRVINSDKVFGTQRIDGNQR
jgi:hypothetical protein